MFSIQSTRVSQCPVRVFSESKFLGSNVDFVVTMPKCFWTYRLTCWKAKVDGWVGWVYMQISVRPYYKSGANNYIGVISHFQHNCHIGVKQEQQLPTFSRMYSKFVTATISHLKYWNDFYFCNSIVIQGLKLS